MKETGVVVATWRDKYHGMRRVAGVKLDSPIDPRHDAKVLLCMRAQLGDRVKIVDERVYKLRRKNDGHSQGTADSTAGGTVNSSGSTEIR